AVVLAAAVLQVAAARRSGLVLGGDITDAHLEWIVDRGLHLARAMRPGVVGRTPGVGDSLLVDVLEMGVNPLERIGVLDRRRRRLRGVVEVAVLHHTLIRRSVERRLDGRVVRTAGLVAC